MIGMFSARYIILFFYSLRVFNLIGQKKILLVILSTITSYQFFTENRKLECRILNLIKNF
ncbi:hypothetical protein RhiirA1_232898 [Rhizophagus irregularis]|uniref:Uncharacterized protein n=1 Tax=Rhizophagus irregularis TaxID=588596 RepID=A0A2I1F7F9_9GLOM|nr:hypothetical protein RhiirA1_232898 [Rhizophagus irregularis]PKY30302.1 hypothetical protein RhiirB3_69013 [Rhizophagus irregularis]